MLQFITTGSDRFSIEEEARMAIDGGCRWIQLSSKALNHDETIVRQTAGQLIPICQEADCFMIIEDNVELVDELRVHGVFLHDAGRATVASARERLGANAVLGVQPRSLTELMNLHGLDVDYVAVTPEVAASLTETDSVEDMAAHFKQLIDSMRLRGLDIHVVATGDFPPEYYPGLLKAGCAGIAVSAAIAEAPDPTAATARLLEVLDAARQSVAEADE